MRSATPDFATSSAPVATPSSACNDTSKSFFFPDIDNGAGEQEFITAQLFPLDERLEIEYCSDVDCDQLPQLFPSQPDVEI
jgi:hypothetical protein